VLQGFRGIIDEIHDDAAKQPAVGAHRRQIFGKSGLSVMPSSRPENTSTA